MTEQQRRRMWLVATPYLAVIAAVAAGIAPIWCLGVVLALPLAVRVVREDAASRATAVAYSAVFVGQVAVGFVIKGIVR